jgi:hypothetical protein
MLRSKALQVRLVMDGEFLRECLPAELEEGADLCVFV